MIYLRYKRAKGNKKMIDRKEMLLDRMIAIYGFENPYVINFAKACESGKFTEDVLEVVVRVHEANPHYDEEDE